MEFFTDNWIAILSLAIAGIGGVPGVLMLIGHYRKRQAFGFTLQNVVTGQDGGEAGNSMVLLTGILTNERETPIIPGYYELEISLDDSAYAPMIKALIPKGLQLNSQRQDIELPSPNDLQQCRDGITFATPLYGQLMFASLDLDFKTLQNARCLRFLLTCHDVFGKKHRTEFDHYRYRGAHKVASEHPKQGLRIRPKETPQEDAGVDS